MAHVETLLQRMPELIASAIYIEYEKQRDLMMQVEKYSDSVIYVQ